MSSPAPPLKRRRLDNSSALSKPFKSPLKAPSDPAAPGPTPATSLPAGIPSKSTPFRPTPTQSSSKTASHTKPTPQLLALRAQHATLQSTLSAARSSLDIALQAQKLESGNTDAELKRLIGKWRRASRDAAEEVFRETRDRVNRMGGVRGWREKMREWRGEWDGGGKEDEEAVDEDEGFTMDMMLRSLNIDLDIIGFDKEGQRWRE